MTNDSSGKGLLHLKEFQLSVLLVFGCDSAAEVMKRKKVVCVVMI